MKTEDPITNSGNASKVQGQDVQTQSVSIRIDQNLDGKNEIQEPLLFLGVKTAAAFNEALPTDHPFWGQLIELLTDYVESRIKGNVMVCVNGKMQRLIWSGLSDPDVGEIINMSFRSIFHIPGTATSGRRKGRHWDPTKRAHQPKKHDLPKWTGEMWSLYWFLVGSPFPVLDSILWNMAVTDPNTKQGLDPISIPVKDKDGEFEVKELKTAQAMPYQILPKPFPNPSHDLIAAEDLQILKMAVDASGYQDKLFLGLVVEHIWSWRPSEDQPTWKAEICAEDLISCFPSETQEQLKSRIYKISALYFPKLGADYLLRKLLDGLPKHLHALAKDIWESPKTNRDERIAAFVKKTGLSQETIENMLRELQSFRADWAIRCLPDELKERLAPLFEI